MYLELRNIFPLSSFDLDSTLPYVKRLADCLWLAGFTFYIQEKRGKIERHK
jgi:hypothetical protein